MIVSAWNPSVLQIQLNHLRRMLQQQGGFYLPCHAFFSSCSRWQIILSIVPAKCWYFSRFLSTLFMPSIMMIAQVCVANLANSFTPFVHIYNKLFWTVRTTTSSRDLKPHKKWFKPTIKKNLSDFKFEDFTLLIQPHSIKKCAVS
jgi:hypothetical protein